MALLALTGEARGQARVEWPGFANRVGHPDSVILLPEPTGPHLVGTVAYHWIDEGRAEKVTDDPGDLRQVIAQVWYPAAPLPDPVLATYVPELEAMRSALLTRSDTVPQRIAVDLSSRASVRGHALSGPPLDEADQAPRYPVVLFSPGGNMSRHWHTALMQELASHGYVAVAISHPYVGWDVFPAGGFLESIDWGLDADDPAAATTAEDTLADLMAEDALLVLERLASLDEEDADGRMTGRLDLEHVAIVGHSRGANTVTRACRVEAGIDACVVMDAIGTDRDAATGLQSPQMTIRRGDWDEDRVARLRAFLARNAVEAWDVAIDEANHFTFSDLPIVDPVHYPSAIDPRAGHRIVSDLLRAFLDTWLERPDARPFSDVAGELSGVAAVRVVP